MTGTRSEATPSGFNPIGTKTKYSEYNLTRYPDAYDSRDNNGNMKGFTNMQDYNMAEHVNALADSLMVIQRMLGLAPEGTHSNITTRLNVLDQHNHDSRYGGTGWITSQTLKGHTHTGAAGHPSKINLAGEVQGKLAKASLDLSVSTGLTGADIVMSPASSKKVSEAIDDKLSTSEGGQVQKNLHVKGKFSSRFFREWDSEDASGSSITSYETKGNTAKRISGTAYQSFINENARDLEYGQYVVGVRLRTSSNTSSEVAHIRLYSHLGGKYVAQEKKIYGTDFSAVGKWQTFYLVGTAEGDSSTSSPIVRVAKTSTATSVDVDFDHAYMMPVTPAVFDI